ncbi:peroxidase 2-like [Phragmites australis]|uniref:peroxidase 2-like n=1 Tax=Phragmites australis TaxID=29695 RepID=UPI002D76D655|nr:peroxidase 2-like [Phragmites australis]
MAMATCNLAVLLLVAAAALSTPSLAQSPPLRYNFYNSSCPQAEATVRSVTEAIIRNDLTMGAAFVRLFFHDCFVRGCDASILLDPSSSNPSTEKRAIPLQGYDAVNQIKAAVEAVCPNVVSCADILAFAARDSAVVSGGFTSFAMPSGRRDGTVSNFFDVLQHIPSPTFKLQDLINNFAAKGMSVDDLVTLSGAHSFGQAHCSFFNGRLYPTVDPTMDATFAAALKTVCPPPGSNGGNPVVNNNNVTDPNKLSNQYYSNVIYGKVLFKSDQQLLSRTDTAAKVAGNSADPAAWMGRFAAALVKMGGIQVLTGTAGQVRKLCYATNR